MTTLEKLKVIRTALPLPELLCQLAEESSELTQASLKYKRAMEGTTPVSVAAALSNLHEEIADVLACFAVLGFINPEKVDAIKASKIDRWYERLIGGKIRTGKSLYCRDCKYWKYYLQETKAVPGLCCDCEWDQSGFCGDFAENVICKHKKEDGSCWK